MNPVTPFRKSSPRYKLFWVLGVVLFVVAILVLTTPWPSDLLTRPLVVSDMPKQVDVVVVLGAGTRKGSDPLPLQAQQRVRRGIELLKFGFTQHVILSGGLDKKTGLVEATLMKTESVRDGADPHALYTEATSTSTHENAVNSLKIIHSRKWNSIAVVTSDFHTWRACRDFRKQWENTICISVPYARVSDSLSDRLIRFRSVAREYGAIILSAFKGYL